jgi:hypothetical protein
VPRLLLALAALCICVPAVALATADTDPKERLTAADQAKARSVVLKRSDFVAGWKKVPPEPDTDAVCPGFNPDGSDLTLTGKAESDFEHTQGLPLVSSFADVYVTKADASASWSRTVKPALARCLAHFMREGAKEEGVELTIATSGRVAFPKVAPRTAAFRVVARMTVEQPGAAPVKVPFTIHVVVVGQGRGEAGLFTAGIGNGVPMADLRFFAKLMATRLAAAKL